MWLARMNLATHFHFPRALVVQMNYHKTLPTPKVTSQDWYFSRKLRTHLLGVYVANEGCLHCYFYDDIVAGAGPNEVISLLHCTLLKLTEQYGTFDQISCGHTTDFLPR